VADRKDPEAPHGYEEDGVTPKAPYGWKADGTPKLSNRGRSPKGGTRKTSAATQGRSEAARKLRTQQETLLALADAVLSPAMAAVSTPAAAQRLGRKRADGLAGSLVILDGFVPAYVDQVLVLSQSKPGMLRWMDTMEEKAPLMTLGIITVQALKAIATNMASPSAELAEAARLKARVRAAQMAQAAREEAAKLGVSLYPDPEPARDHPNPTDMADAPHPAGVPA
jgi:hypothetical protein